MGVFLTMPMGSAKAADILFDAQDVGERFEFHFLFGKCQNPEMMFLRGVFSKLTSFHFFPFSQPSHSLFFVDSSFDSLKFITLAALHLA